jgi:hypothetical protein
MKTIFHYDAGPRLMARLAAPLPDELMARLAAPLPDAEVLLFRVV